MTKLQQLLNGAEATFRGDKVVKTIHLPETSTDDQ